MPTIRKNTERKLLEDVNESSAAVAEIPFEKVRELQVSYGILLRLTSP
jgi:hypothetical protein